MVPAPQPDASETGSSRPLPITERERRFAVAYVEASLELMRDDAQSETLAYFRAFPRSVHTESEAARLAKFLMRRPPVRDLIQHLRHELSNRAMVPASRVLDEIERIALANVADVGRIDDEGQFQVDMSRASYRTLAALGQIETTERVLKTDGNTKVVQRKTKIKLEKMAALQQLARVHGLYDETAMLEALLTLGAGAVERNIARMEQQLSAPTIEGNAT